MIKTINKQKTLKTLTASETMEIRCFNMKHNFFLWRYLVFITLQKKKFNGTISNLIEMHKEEKL